MLTDNIAYDIAIGCRERAKALGYKGRRRDDFALDYWAGATFALVSTEGLNSQRAHHLATIGHLVLSPRGYSEIERLAAKGDEQRGIVKAA
jgi:hypothetical protein